MASLTTLSFILIVITAMVILVFRDWRINAIALGIQYVGVFILVTLSWPLGMAVVKLIVGWMATAALAITNIRQKIPAAESQHAASLSFRGILGLFVILIAFIVAPTLSQNMFKGINLIIIQSGLVLSGMALMQLGTTSDPYLVIISLLNLLSGFEIIHAALEISTLLTGLLAVVNLGLSLVGVTFLIKSDNQPQKKEGDA